MAKYIMCADLDPKDIIRELVKDLRAEVKSARDSLSLAKSLCEALEEMVMREDN
ncbi:MAG: hypothetical protein FWC00_02135 [Firmicutes bacterium]|nr:hypothetical protein [Bacillota bacterium]